MTDRSPDFTTDSADRLRRAVGDLVRAVRRDEATPDGQIETLGHLARDGTQSIAGLARRRRIRHQSMSSTIAELEARGLVGRSPDPSDARGVLVFLTSEGSSTIRESRLRRSRAILLAAETALTVDERRTLALAPALLDKLTAALLDD